MKDSIRFSVLDAQLRYSCLFTSNLAPFCSWLTPITCVFYLSALLQTGLGKQAG
jgi:hypothetical protein